MPLLSTSGPAAAKGFGFLRSRREAGFLGKLACADTATARGVAGTATNEIYVAGEATPNPSGPSPVVGAHIAKFSSTGVAWEKRLAGGTTTRFYSCAIAASGNVYAAGQTNYPGGTYAFLVKYSSSGTLLWQRQLGFTSGFVAFYRIKVDSSENIFATGLSTFYGVSSGILIKYDSNGNVLFQRDCGGGSYAVSFNSSAIASSGNIYCVGYAELAGYNYNPFVAKYNSSGFLQWQRRIDGGNYGEGIALDSSENCYIVGLAADSFLTKLNSSGVIQWSKTHNGGGRNINVDSYGNLCIVGGVVSKFDATGEVLFSRRLDNTGLFDLGTVQDSIYVSGDRYNQMVFGRLPNDGAGLGSYTLGAGFVVAYEAVTASSTTVTYTTTTTTYSDRSAGLASSASALTESSPASPSAVSTIYV